MAELTETRKGLTFGLAAYGAWGIFPLFWKELGHVPSSELLVHRIAGAMVVFTIMSLAWRRGRELGGAWRAPKTRRLLIASSVLVGVNWFFFVYAVETDRVLHASLGYFINPIVSIVLAMVFLGERLRPPQWVAVAIALAAVGIMAGRTDDFPWISLVLAGSFGTYGLLRKIAKVDALPGTNVETLLLGVPCLGVIAWMEFGGGGGHFIAGDGRTKLLLLLTGVVTALPLFWFTGAARRLRLSTMGFLQYLAPSLQFVLAVFVFNEPLEGRALFAFCLIWTALMLFSVEAWRHERRARAKPT